MDDEQRAFIDTFRRFLEEVVNSQRREQGLTPLGLIVQEFLGADVRVLPVVAEQIAPHRLVDLDLAMADLACEGESRLLGVSHGQMREHEELPALLNNPYAPFDVAPVDYESVATGPDEERQVVTHGVHLIRFRGHAVAALQRGASPQSGRAVARLDVLAENRTIASAFIREVRERMVRLSVLRGKVLSFTASDYSQSAAGATFLRRPTVAASDVVLPNGALETVSRHVIGIGEHRDRLVGAGQHLKRGVLLYGPPGTGKTLTVRHLLASTPGTTAVLLTGSSIRFITEAAEIARAMQPALVVLEDVDLVASDRMMHGGPQPLLFAVLDALDGLDGDADVTFLLTTNRVELLESALAERPGRVDLALEVPLPDGSARRRLFRLYARGLPLTGEAVDASADRAEGVTASFAKELVRRAVLAAAEDDRDVTDADLSSALDGLLSDREDLTRNLISGRGVSAHRPASEGGASYGWTAYTPLAGTSYGPSSGAAMASTLDLTFDPTIRDGGPRGGRDASGLGGTPPEDADRD